MSIIIKHNVPFYSQMFPHDEGTFEGFNSFEEMKFWEKKACGAVCLKMIIEFFLSQRISVGTIVKKGIELDAYSECGWIHKGLVAMANYFGLEANDQQNTKFDDIRENIAAGRICIASVVPRFLCDEDSYNEDTKRCGHLVLIIGYEKCIGQDYFIVHHPSYNVKYNWVAKKITEKHLMNNFSGNIISIENKL